MIIRLVFTFLFGSILMIADFSRSGSIKQQKPEALSDAQKIARAKEKGETRIVITTSPSVIPQYAEVNNLDDALSRYAVITAQPTAKHSYRLSDTITTWYKFKVIENLSDKTFSERTDHADAPQELLPLKQDEILVPKSGGTVVIDGLEVIFEEPNFPQFKMSQKYLLFLQPDPFSKRYGRIGAFAMGPKGVFLLNNNGIIESIIKQAHPLKHDLGTLFGNSLNQIRVGLKSRYADQAILREAIKQRQKAERLARRTSRQNIPEEYVVYSVLIEKMYVRDKIELIVIEDRTSAHSSEPGKLSETLRQVNKVMPEIKKETLADFETKNEQPHTLTNLFDLKIKTTLIGAAETNKFFGEGGGWWQAFYEKYPKSQGIMTLSRVGFNTEMNQALVYVGNQRAGLDGEGIYVLLVREADDDWIVQDRMGMWVS